MLFKFVKIVIQESRVATKQENQEKSGKTKKKTKVRSLKNVKFCLFILTKFLIFHSLQMIKIKLIILYGKTKMALFFIISKNKIFIWLNSF